MRNLLLGASLSLSLLLIGATYVSSPSGQYVYSENRNIGTILSNRCNGFEVTVDDAGVKFPAGQPCTVGFPLDVNGGAGGVSMVCWPSATNKISVRACCNNNTSSCITIATDYTYTVDCTRGTCL